MSQPDKGSPIGKSPSIDDELLTRSEPPGLASSLLIRSLGSSPETHAILGDLCEDFAQVVRDKGRLSARWWFWREALLLSLTLRGTGSKHSSPQPSERLTLRKIMTEASPLATLTTDARYALRAVRNDLRLFVLSVLIIGFGVGACAAVYSILSPLLLRELPFTDPGNLVWVANKGEGGLSAVTSRTFNLRDFRAHNQSFDGLTGFDACFDEQSFNLIGDGEPVRLLGVGVVGNFLEVLGVRPKAPR